MDGDLEGLEVGCELVGEPVGETLGRLVGDLEGDALGRLEEGEDVGWLTVGLDVASGRSRQKNP